MINSKTASRARRLAIVAAATTTAAVGIGLVAPAAANADAKDACTGVRAHCRIVATTDVTGDGKKDSVGIVIQKADGPFVTSYQVRVRTAQGELVRATDKDAGWEGDIYFGAAAIDGRPGKDLVVGHVEGAHTAFYHVLAYQQGQLVLRKSPKLPAPAAKDMDTYGRSWVVDGAVSSFAGIRRTVSHGQVILLENFGSRDPSAAKYAGWHVAYRWSAGHWTLASYRRQSWTDKQAASHWGWHVRGLPR